MKISVRQNEVILEGSKEVVSSIISYFLFLQFLSLLSLVAGVGLDEG